MIIITMIVLILLSIFSKSSSEIIQIQEELKNGSVIEGLTKFLKTVIIHQTPSYRIIEDDKLYRSLYIDSKTNSILVKDRIDRESLCPISDKCILQLKFLLSPSFQSISLNVEILDINDNAPSWPQRSKIINFIEFEGNKMEYRYIQIDKASDPDVNENNRITYFLKEKDGITDNKNFKIKYDLPSSRKIALSPSIVIDREKVDQYEMVLLAQDNGMPRLTGSLEITINVLDKNDNGPIFERTQYRNDGLSESVPIGSVVLTVYAKDLDAGNNGKITYRIDDRKTSEFFFIDDNGRLLVKQILNYDAGIKNFQFSVLAIDGAPEEYRKTGECEVVISIKDENDEKPEILIHVNTRDPLTNEPAIIENEVTQNFVLAHIQVKDPDFDGTDRVSCTLINNAKIRLEQVPSSDNEFQIMAISSFDREERSMEKVDISCVDQAQNMASKSIAFQILDLNDNDPKFTRVFHFRITENFTNPNMLVGEIMAVDKDAASNSKIEFQIIGNENQFFKIDSSGKLYTRKILDREENERFNLTILAKDGGDPPRTGTGLVIIDITDINDWKPQFNSSFYEFSIRENSPIGSIVGTVMATDRDLPANTFMKYRLIQYGMRQVPFSITRSTHGDIITRNPLDREEQSIYMLEITATDGGLPHPLTSTVSAKVFIMDINDNPPIFKTNNFTIFSLQMTDTVGQEIGTVEATDSDYGENSEIEYRIEKNNFHRYFALNPQTGKINLSYQFSKQADHKLIIIACDRGNPKLCSSPLFITIKVVKSTVVPNSDPLNQDPLISDSKAYVFIICVLVILLLIIIILIVCVIIFKNRICYPLSHDESNNGGDMNSMETSNKKMNSENIRNANGHSVQSSERLIISQQRSNQMQNPNFDLSQRERQLSADYQSIGGGSPPYNQNGVFWDDAANLHPHISDIIDQTYLSHNRNTQDYYPPSSNYGSRMPAGSYRVQAQPTAYFMKMDNIQKEPQYCQETRYQPPKRYNSLVNFQLLNSPNSDSFYKSLRKEKNKASFV